MDTIHFNMDVCSFCIRIMIRYIKGKDVCEVRAVYERVLFNPAPSDSEIVVLFSGESQTVPKHKYVQINLDHVLIHFVLSGKGCFLLQGSEYDLGPGDSFFIFPNEIASYVADEHEPWEYQWVALKGGYVQHVLREMGISKQSPTAHTSRIGEMSGLYRKIFRTLEHNRVSSDIEVGGHARMLLAHYMEEKVSLQSQSVPFVQPAIQKQIDQMARWLQTRYMEPLSIELMAQELGYHRTYLSKMFSRYIGRSPMQYLTALRLERASILLRSRQKFTIEEVAFSVGYRDPLYFSKLFKQKYGKSPSEYRE
jgi:AraC-like DNA-binding protein/quercetin dioxygenase-like cupin family protein